MPKYFGHRCDFLVEGIFSILSDGTKFDKVELTAQGWKIGQSEALSKASRVYFKTFIERFYFALWNENPREREKLIFSLLDFDRDGIITGKDLTRCYEMVDTDSKFG